MIILAFAENTIQLVPDGTLLLHLSIVIIMVAILNRTMFRPINKVLADREAQTAGRAAEARKLREDVEKSLTGYERGLRDARNAGYHLIEVQRVEALKAREQQVAQVRDEIRGLTAREKADIERQVAEARQTLRAEAVASAAEIGSQILRRRLD